MSQAKSVGSGSALTMMVCFLVTVLEGYDLQIISSAGPMLQREMGLSPEQTGLFFSASLIGLAFGACSLWPPPFRQVLKWCWQREFWPVQDLAGQCRR
jgi:MFS family permease